MCQETKYSVCKRSLNPLHFQPQQLNPICLVGSSFYKSLEQIQCKILFHIPFLVVFF